MATIAYIILGLALGYAVRWFQNRAQRRRFAHFRKQARRIADEMVEKSDQMAQIIIDQDEQLKHLAQQKARLITAGPSTYRKNGVNHS